jgi:hypothetical protein
VKLVCVAPAMNAAYGFACKGALALYGCTVSCIWRMLHACASRNVCVEFKDECGTAGLTMQRGHLKKKGDVYVWMSDHQMS